MMTTKEAAAALGKPGKPLSTQRIRALLAEGKLSGRKHGRDWLIDEWSVHARLPKESQSIGELLFGMIGQTPPTGPPFIHTLTPSDDSEEQDPECSICHPGAQNGGKET